MRWLLLIALVACKQKQGLPDPLAKLDAGLGAVDAAPPPLDAGVAKAGPKPVKVAVGHHTTCALMADATVRCWGKNDAGQLGNGTTKDSATPVKPPLLGVKDIVLGAAHACALLDDGSVTCWGRINYGNRDNLLTPIAPGIAKATRVFAVLGAACATIEDGELVCWGDVDSKGHVRRGAPRAFRAPTPVPGITGVTEIAATGDVTCVLREDGATVCLGAKLHCAKVAKVAKVAPKGKPKARKGGKAKPVAQAKPPPAPAFDVLRVPPATHLALGAGLCVIAKTGTVECLAKDGCSAESPWPELTGVVAVDESCARLATGGVRCWTSKERALRPVPGVKSARSIAAGETHACAVLTSNTVVCWGSNKHGALGRGNADEGNYPEASAAAL